MDPVETNDKVETMQVEENETGALSAEKGQMKKEDSGISIGIPSTSVNDNNEVAMECTGSDSGVSDTKKEGETSLSPKKKKSEVNGFSSPDSGNPDGSDSPTASPPENSTRAKSEMTLTSTDLGPCGKKTRASKLKRKATRELDSSNGSDSDDASTKSTEKAKSSDDDEKSNDPTPKTEKPKHKWFLCQELIDRQIGKSSKYSNDLFRLRCYSSLHMVERLELMYKMKKHEGCVNTLHFNNTGTRLVTGSDDLNIVMWDWTVEEPVLTYDSGHKNNVFQTKFMPLRGDCHIVSCARDGQVRIAELSSTGICKGTRRLAQHKGPAHKIALENDSPHSFLTSGEDAIVYQIDLRESKASKVVLAKENDSKVPLYTIFVNPVNSCEFAVGGRDNFVRIYDRRFVNTNDTPMKKFCPHHLIDSDVKANVTCLVYNYNGKEILSSYNDEDIYIFDTSHSDGADFVKRYQGHRNNQTVKGVNYFGPHSEYVVSGSDCGFIYFWDKESGHIVQTMRGDEGGVVNCLEPHPTMPAIATSGLDDDIKIWVPSCENPPDLTHLKARICNNMKEREREKENNGMDTIDSQMLFYIMQHLRHSARRRARAEGQEVSSSSSDSDSSNNSDSPEEDAEEAQSIQCSQS